MVVYGIVELANGIQESGVGLIDYKRGKAFVEASSPSRWDNPVLVAFKSVAEVRKLEKTGEDFDFYETRVVAIPLQKGKPFAWGYGYRYRGVYMKNRKYWKPQKEGRIPKNRLETTLEYVVGEDE